MIYGSERVERGNLVLSAPRGSIPPARKKGHSSSFNRGARCMRSVAPVTNFGVTRHLPLTSCTLHPRSWKIGKERRPGRFSRGAGPAVFFFHSALITIVFSVDFRKSITMATV